ncbi:MAG: serine/threonine-protein kinase [Pseudomonadota bacterium]
MSTPPLEPDFAELDALLDQALALEGEAQASFLRNLPEPQRERVADLLARAETQPLNDFAGQVSEVIEASGLAERFAGNWRLQRELGSGGMGQVWFAVREDEGFTQQAAIKILWSHRADEDLKSRFYRERRILAGLDHPGLARFLDGGLMADGLPWFAMEYVEGNDLAGWAAGQTLPARLELFAEICETVQFAHEHLVIHRDLKPANILVDATGRARLLDFGVAAMTEAGREDLLTGPEGSPITLQYASPEQVSGGLVSVASDVYQLGLILYELVAGQPPYVLAGLPLREAIAAICDLPAPGAGVGPADIASVALKALRKSPAERYSSAGALAEDVRHVLAGEPVTARPRTALYVAARFVQRHAAVCALVVVFVLGLAAATGVSLKLARDARDAADRSDRARSILTSVIEMADPFQGPGEAGPAEATLAEALITAEAEIAEQLGGDARLTAEVYLELGQMFSRQSLLAEELRAYENALAAAEQLGSAGERLRLGAAAGLGNALVRQDPAQAASFFARELPSAPPGDAFSADWVTAKYSQISALTRLRRIDEADQVIEELAQAADRYGFDSERSRARLSNLLASRASRAGDLAAADGHWAAALAAMRRADNPYGLAIMLSNYGIHLGRSGRFAPSETAFKESTQIFESHAPGDAGYGNVLRAYAGLKVRNGDPGGAVDLLERSRSILVDTGEHYSHFTTLLNLTDYALVADRPAVSVQAGVEGLALVLSEFGVESDAVRRIIPPLARALSASGEAQRALRLAIFGADPTVASAEQLAELAGLALDAGAGDLVLALVATAGEQDGPPPATLLAVRIRQHLQAGQQALARRWAYCVGPDSPGPAEQRQVAFGWVALTEAAGWPPVVAALGRHPSAFMDLLDRQRLKAAAGVPVISIAGLSAAQQLRIDTMLERLGAPAISAFAQDFRWPSRVQINPPCKASPSE